VGRSPSKPACNADALGGDYTGKEAVNTEVIDWPTIVREHGPAVWRTVYRLLNQHPDAQDCYQEAFLAAWRCAREAPVSDWHGLLVSLGARKAMDRLRKRYRERRRGTAMEAAREAESGEPSPVQRAVAGDLMERVRHCLADMPEEHAQVFWLCCVEGLSHEHISQRLGITPGAARVCLHRARELLRAELNQEEPVERGRHERRPGI
jgi:RNA polymerase sigma-70 factor, ECF subfamily